MRAMVGGQSGPKPTASLCPPSPPWRAAPLLPVHAWLSPLSSWQRWLCHPTPVARATPEPAARVTACAAAHAQLGMVPVVWPGRMGAAAMPRCCRVPQPVQQCMAHPVPWSHQRITDPGLLHPRCWLSPIPPGHAGVAGMWPPAGTVPSQCRQQLLRRMGALWHVPPGGMSLELCLGHGAGDTVHGAVPLGAAPGSPHAAGCSWPARRCQRCGGQRGAQVQGSQGVAGVAGWWGVGVAVGGRQGVVAAGDPRLLGPGPVAASQGPACPCTPACPPAPAQAPLRRAGGQGGLDPHPPPRAPWPRTHGRREPPGGRPSSPRCWTGWSGRSRSWRGCWQGSPPRSAPGAPTPWCWARTCPSRAVGIPHPPRGLVTARGAPRSAGTAEGSGQGWGGPGDPGVLPTPSSLYHVLHGAQVLGAVAVAVVVSEVSCCVAILVTDAEVGTVHHQDLAALGRGGGARQDW